MAEIITSINKKTEDGYIKYPIGASAKYIKIFLNEEEIDLQTAIESILDTINDLNITGSLPEWEDWV